MPKIMKNGIEYGGGTSNWTKVFESSTPDNENGTLHYDLDGLDFEDIYLDIIYADLQNQSQGIGWSTMSMSITKQALLDRFALGTSNCIYTRGGGCYNGNQDQILVTFKKNNNKLAFTWMKRRVAITGTTITYLTDAYIRIYVR